MCGIAGILYKSGEGINRDEFRSACNLMAHRGPDYFGEYHHGDLSLFHYRLSILDLDPRSNQPFFTDDHKKVMVYNGEVYNYRDVAAKYQVNLHTSSDTEVLIKTFERSGPHVLKHWNGIFAAACFDETGQELTLIRDRFGVKPLYLYEDEKVIAFASEAKVILNWLPSFHLNPQSLAEYLWYGNPLGEETLVKGLKKLKPGVSISIDCRTFQQKEETFWSLKESLKNSPNPSFTEAVETTRTLLEAAIQRQLISDVPVGVFLSGGIDSSAITAFASRHIDGRLNTYSVEYDFNKGGKSEMDKAALIARKFGTNHHELMVDSKDLPEVFEQLVFQYDEPFADAANLPLYFLARECRNDMTVVLQGDGGDELFAGYRRYNLLNNLSFWKLATRLGSTLISRGITKQRLKRIASNLNEPSDARRMAYIMTEATRDGKPESIVNPEWQELLRAQNPFRIYEQKNKDFEEVDLVQRMLYTDLEVILPATYLEKVDKATMLCSIEARVPFLDNDLASYVLGLPASYKVRNGEKKYLLKRALSGIIPDEILNAPKRGFDMPFKTWLQTTLYAYAKDKIMNFSDPCDLIDRKRLLCLLDEHKKGLADHGVMLWKALVLIVWLDKYASRVVAGKSLSKQLLMQ